MGIRFSCPNGHRLHVKAYLAGQRGICPNCGVRVQIPVIPSPSAGQTTAPGNQEVDSAAVSSAAESVSSILQQASPSHGPGRGKQDRDEQERDETGNPVPTLESLNVGPSIDLAGGSSSSDSIIIQTVPRANPAPQSSPSPPTDSDAPNQASGSTSSGNASSSNSAKPAWYVRPPSGGQFGPADAETFSRWMHEKRVVADSFVWCDGWPDWQRAGDIADQLPGPSNRIAGIGGNIATSGDGVDGAMPVVDTTVDKKAMESSAVNTLRKSRQRTQRFQMAVAAMLLVAVLTLLGVLIRVMMYTPPPKSHPGGAVQIDSLDLPAAEFLSHKV